MPHSAKKAPNVSHARSSNLPRQAACPPPSSTSWEPTPKSATRPWSPYWRPSVSTHRPTRRSPIPSNCMRRSSATSSSRRPSSPPPAGPPRSRSIAARNATSPRPSPWRTAPHSTRTSTRSRISIPRIRPSPSPTPCRWATTPCTCPLKTAPPMRPSSTPPRISQCPNRWPTTIVGAGWPRCTPCVPTNPGASAITAA